MFLWVRSQRQSFLKYRNTGLLDNVWDLRENWTKSFCRHFSVTVYTLNGSIRFMLHSHAIFSISIMLFQKAIMVFIVLYEETLKRCKNLRKHLKCWQAFGYLCFTNFFFFKTCFSFPVHRGPKQTNQIKTKQT